MTFLSETQLHAFVTYASVTLCKHVIIGSGSVVLPAVTLHEGVAIGALSMIDKDCDAFEIYAGVPARKIKNRQRDLLTYETYFLSSFLA